jgi:hypothetical protein
VRAKPLFVLAACVSAFLLSESGPARADVGTRLSASIDRWVMGEAILGSIVRDGWVDYDLLHQKRGPLDRDLRYIAIVDKMMGPGAFEKAPAPQRLSFYINAYNLATLDLIDRERVTRGGRLKSIQEIPAAWTRPKWKVAGVERSLDEIEHQILRKEFHEPRIHMALVCASVSCPSLRAEPYRGSRLDGQLEEASRAFVNDSTRNRFEPRDGTIQISKIFDWYGDDFVGAYRDSTLEGLYGEKDGAVLAFAARYLPAETSAAWKAAPLKIEYLPYDWALNDWRSNAAPAAKR